MKKLKITCLVLASVMLVMLFGGCQKGDKNVNSGNIGTEDYGDTGGIKLPLVDKPVTISAMVNSSYPALEEKLVFKELEKRTGLKLDIIEVPSSSYNERLNVTMATGKLPDLVLTSDFRSVNKIAAQGALEPINKHLDKLPNFKKLYLDDPECSEIVNSYNAADGNLYLWPRYDAVRTVNVGFMYRKDIFDKHGIKMWENSEEFYQALKKLKEIYPDSTPYVSQSKDNIFTRWSYGWGLVAPGMYYDENNGLWKLSSTQPEYKDMLDFMKKLYNEQLLDSEFLTDTQANFTSKMTQENKAFVINDWIGRLDMFYNQVKDSIPEYDLRYANTVGPVGESIINTRITDYGTMIANGPNKEIALRLMDYLCSPSGAELMTMGVKDSSYKIDANNNISYPEFEGVPTISITELQEKYGCYTDGICPRVDTRGVYHKLSEKEQEAYDIIMNNNKGAKHDPNLLFTAEDEAVVNEINQNLDKAAREFSVKYILNADYGDAQWEEWKQYAKKLNENKIVDIYNKTQQKANK